MIYTYFISSQNNQHYNIMAPEIREVVNYHNNINNINSDKPWVIHVQVMAKALSILTWHLFHINRM